MKLYELTSNFTQIQDMIDNDADNETLLDTLESIELAIEEKAENICKISKTIKGDVATIDLEIKRLQARKKTLNNNLDGLLSYLKTQLEIANKTQIKGNLFNVTVRKNQPALKIVDESKINDCYKTIIPELKVISNDLVKTALINGETVEGAELTYSTSLLIK